MKATTSLPLLAGKIELRPILVITMPKRFGLDKDSSSRNKISFQYLLSISFFSNFEKGLPTVEVDMVIFNRL